MNIYELHRTDGKSHTVETKEHHDNHSDSAFKTHLAGFVTGLAANTVSHFVFKGRRKPPVR